MSTTQAPLGKGNNSASSEYAEAAADKATQYAEKAVDQGAEYAEQAQDIAAEKLGEIETAIRRNPIQAAAIAAGVGFVLALIARR